MKLSSKSFYKNLIQEEVDFCLRYANLDERERALFLYRNDKKSIEEIAEIMNCSVSTVNRINRTLNNKIKKASPLYYPGISKEWK